MKKSLVFKNVENKDLVKMKLIATSILVFFAIIFIVSLNLEHRFGFFGYLRAFSEASMIGGLADWFAVVALFKYPLGLPFPHTNLINRNKKEIAKNLSHFIYLEFLSKEKITNKLRSVSEKAINYIKNSNNSDLFGKLMDYYPKKIVFDDAEIKQFVTNQTDSFFKKIDLSLLFSSILNILSKNNEHQKVFDEILHQSIGQLTDKENIGYIYRKLDEKTKFYHVGVETYTEKMFEVVIELLNEIKDNPEHELRNRLDDKIKVQIVDLVHKKHQPKLDDLKNDILSSDSYKDFIDNLWVEIKEKIILYLKEQKTTQKSELADGLNEFINSQLEDNYIQYIFENWIVNNISSLVESEKETIEKYIMETVSSWPNISETLENYIGKDLQYIRINGTIVGGLIGLLLYSLTRI